MSLEIVCFGLGRERSEEVEMLIWFERFIVIMLLLSLWILVVVMFALLVVIFWSQGMLWLC